MTTVDEDIRALAKAANKPVNFYREPGVLGHQFLHNETPEGYDNTRSPIQGWIDQEDAIRSDQIKKMKASGHWNWKDGGAIHNGYWEGPPDERGYIVSTLPKKKYTIEELTEKIDQLNSMLDAIVEAGRKNPKDKSKKKPASKK